MAAFLSELVHRCTLWAGSGGGLPVVFGLFGDGYGDDGGDPDIALHTPHQVVKQILLRRADRQRTRLPVQDSSRTTTAESEPSINAHMHRCEQ